MVNDTDVCNEPASCIFKIKALYDEKEEEYSSFEVFTAMWCMKPRHWIIVFFSFRRNILPSKDREEINQ